MVRNKKAEPTELMIVNDSPGEECRIAILADGHLEELFSETTASATNVGSIYKGRVTNVEPAIQAAFVDFGQGTSGFLHISDLHPRYFPGKERTEQVGKKIPRKARPPIQEALRRGDEVLVQVLKEGLGTKGPTLTSYLSIPGRLLVMMPDMDRVGVSRKVEDDETRRRARKLLDALELPDGFGFILRTAGLEQTKTALKRDVAYLMRLWKVMEKRIHSVGAPCELFTESDLLVRTVRDVLRPSIEAIIVDSESAFERADAFLRVVSPRSSARIVKYRKSSPIFHAFDIERQIELIHGREVPLASGGKLVIEQTEALVAIDVNSGRSRSARDSETNAYQTNCEAVDEICRQLRLRDLGGLVVNDLIDMYQMRHRRAIEDRMKENLRRDRAKTTVLRLSSFGVLEMTRQRMRPSLRKSHFVACPFCVGNGEIKSAESIASDTVRHAEYLLQFDRVLRLELVCSPRVASVLLSTKRRRLVRMEDETDKRVDVRVSDTISTDRVDFYAYDDRNADIDIDQLPPVSVPTLKELEAAERKWTEPAAAPAPQGEEKSRRRRRRRKTGPADATAMAIASSLPSDGTDEDEPKSVSVAEQEPAGEPAADGMGRKRSRRRRRRRRGEGQPEAAPAQVAASAPDDRPAEESAPSPSDSPVADTSPVADASPVRIYQLAREIGVTSRDLLTRIETDGSIEFEATNHMSSVPAADATMIRDAFGLTPAVSAGPPLRVVEDDGPAEPVPRKKRRSKRGRGSKQAETEESRATEPSDAPDSMTGSKKSKRSRGGSRRRRDSVPAINQEEVTRTDSDSTGSGAKKKGSKSRRRRKKATPAVASGSNSQPDAAPAAPATNTDAPATPRRRRSLYGTRRSVSPASREVTATADDR